MINKNKKVIQRGKRKAYVLRRAEAKDGYFTAPEIMADIEKGIEQFREGKSIKVDKADFDKLLGL